MPANSPEDICRLFQQYMAAGDLDAVLSVFDPEAVLVNWSGEVKQGRDGLRQGVSPVCGHEDALGLHQQAGHPVGRHRADAHRVAGVLPPARVRVCDRGRPPPAGRDMALAHRRPVDGRPARSLLKQGSDRRHGVISRGCGQTRRRSMDGEWCTRRLTGGSPTVLHGFAAPARGVVAETVR